VLFFTHLRHRRQWGQAAAFAAIAVSCPLLFLGDCYFLTPSRVAFRPFFVLLLGLAGWMSLSLLGCRRAQALVHGTPSARQARAASIARRAAGMIPYLNRAWHAGG
jgi:hypothetical protein